VLYEGPYDTRPRPNLGPRIAETERRQAERVLTLVASRYAAQTAAQVPEQTGAQTSRADADDQEDSPARAV
jgi:hypothetical protein